MTHFYSQHHFDPVVNTRRTLGIAMVVLVHAVAIFAISKGTTIADVIKKHQTLQVTMITPEIPKPPLAPIEVKNPSGTSFTIDSLPPVINTEQKEAPPIPETRREPIRENASGVAAQAARIDPKHPLTQPAYPAQSRRMGEQGRVEMLVYVLPSGKIGEARVAHSSGYQRLDDAAVKEALKNWRLLPNEVNGTPIGSWVTLAITFRLTQ